MRNLVVLLLLGFTLGALIIVGYGRGKSEARAIVTDRYVQDLFSKKIDLHSDQEVKDVQCPGKDNPPWKLGKVIGCETSPNQGYLAKFFYNGPDAPDRYYELFVVNLVNKEVKRIWAGDFRTLGWDWKGSNQIEIRYNCGTGCQAVKIMNLNESASIVDYQNGRMSEENGWRIELAGSY